MTRRAAAVLLVILAAAVVGLLLLNRPSLPAAAGRRVFRPFFRVTPAAAPSAAPGVTTPSAGTTPAAAETVRVTLFFPDKQDGKLRPEERDIAKPSGPGAFLKTIFAELQRGPRGANLFNPIPSRMQLRNAFLLPDGVAVLDLAMDSGIAFGSDDELAVLATLVDTTLQNVADTSRVRILVNGEPAETLGGHLDLTRPLSYFRSEVGS